MDKQVASADSIAAPLLYINHGTGHIYTLRDFAGQLEQRDTEIKVHVVMPYFRRGDELAHPPNCHSEHYKIYSEFKSPKMNG